MLTLVGLGVKGAPNDYDFGLHFNYATWLVGTELLLSNVPWNNDYRDIVSFDAANGLDTYLENDSENVLIQNTNTQRFQTSVKINLPINSAMRFNYLRARNPVQPFSGDVQRTYYYFIQDVIYRAFNSTELVLQLDVWSTFGKDVSFGSCYVEQGHIGMANTNVFSNYGRDYLTELEGFDLGSEYRTIHAETTNIIQDTQLAWVLICATVDFNTAAFNETTGAPQQNAATGSQFQGLPSGAGFWYFKSTYEFLAFMDAFSDAPWMTQGIISITLIPPLTRYYASADLPAGKTITANSVEVTMYPVPVITPSVKTLAMKHNWRNETWLNNVLGKYASLSKFKTSPYLIIEITTYTGSPLVIKPEMWQDPDATIRELCALMPPGQRVVFSPNRYNADAQTLDGSETETDSPKDDFGDFLDTSIALDNFPQLPLVNNMAISYLASNRNGIAFQYSNASWDQQRALAGVQAGADVATAGNRNVGRQAAIQNTLQSQQLMNSQNAMPAKMIWGALGSIGQGAVGGGIGGEAGAVAGVGMGTIGAIGNEGVQAIDMGVQQQNLTAALDANSNSAISNIQTGAQIRDTNAAYGRMAAKGDYGMQVRGIQAKVQDARMIQPSTSGQFGGDAFNLINDVYGYSIRWKMLNPQAMRQIGDYWFRYGYKVNQFLTLPASLKCMDKATYWKLSETYISQAPIPESFKQTIRGIFEKGVTVWSNPADIGNIDWSTNTPIGGITY